MPQAKASRSSAATATIRLGQPGSLGRTSMPRRSRSLADSNAAITKGIVALILSAVQDKPAAEVARLDVTEELAPFELTKHLSANRTQGVPNMIALVKQTAQRYAAAA